MGTDLGKYRLALAIGLEQGKTRALTGAVRAVYSHKEAGYGTD
jgi:hypothetical protein